MSASTLARPSTTHRATAPTRSRVDALRKLGAAPLVEPPRLEIGGTAAGQVLRVAHRLGPIGRDVAVRETTLSTATVNRQVAALLEAGAVRERPDLAVAGAVGRPKIPFELAHDATFTLGIHIGLVATAIVAADLRGRLISGIEIPTPTGDPVVVLRSVAQSAAAFATRLPKRRALWVGVALGGSVDADSGVVSHPLLGWRDAPVGEVISATLGLPVSVAQHVEAMAAAELILAGDRSQRAEASDSELYVYVRESAGLALTIGGRVHTPSNGPGSIAHLGTGSAARCECGNIGCLEATVSDRAVIAEARRRGIIAAGVANAKVSHVVRAAEAGDDAAHELLAERARYLGHTLATLRDVFNPDRVTLGGQAFTEYRAGARVLAEAFTERSTFARKDIRVTGFGAHVQQYAAAVAALGRIYHDPLRAFALTAA